MTTTQAKPAKPSPDFPLFPHASGQWAKKINGKLCYFGHWSDPFGALKNYESQDTADGAEDRQQPPKVSADGRPAKPRKDFPLFPHASGQWAKKIRGRTHYFGPWDDHQGALETYLSEKDDLFAGRTPQVRRGEATIAGLAHRFLAHKQQLVDSGELEQRSYDDYEAECDRLKAVFGEARPIVALTSEDFGQLRKKFSKTWGPVTLGNAVNRVRIIFKFAFDERMIPAPVHYGQSFDRPTAKTLRKERQKKGKRLFHPQQIRAMLDEASTSMKAMILLGINCGFGNTDCARLPTEVIDFKDGWIDYAHRKTGIFRRCKLWPETVDALHDVLEARIEPTNKAFRKMLFITRFGDSWASDNSAVTKECEKILATLGIKRPGLTYYALRHTFQTIGEKSRDVPAVRYIMGHAPASNDMSAAYREEIDDERLAAVADCVRTWLYGAASASAA